MKSLSPTGRLCAALFALGLCLAPFGRAKASPGEPNLGIAFYAVAAHPAPGFRAVWVGRSGDADGNIYIAQAPDLTLDDITNVCKEPLREGDEAGTLRYRLVLTTEGRTLFKTITGQRTSGGAKTREAIFVDGQIVSLPVIRQQVDAPSVGLLAFESPETGQPLGRFLDSLQRNPDHRPRIAEIGLNQKG